MTRGVRRIIEDMTTHPDFEPHRAQILACGFTSMQGTPLVTRDGRAVGGICTTFRRCYTPPEEELQVLDLYARAAAAVIERHQQIDELRQRTMILSSTNGMLVESIKWLKDRIDEIEVHSSSLNAGEIRRIAKLTKNELQSAIRLAGANDSGYPPDGGLERFRHPYGLSLRELEVLISIWKGLSDKEIATRLRISRFTVARHVGAVLRKMNADSRTQVAIRAEREGLMSTSLIEQNSRDEFQFTPGTAVRP
jgi:DNA-binding NarL/FixJ family response regulator